jgi:hypothetical protein
MHNKAHMDSEFGRGSQGPDMDRMDSLDRDSGIGSAGSDVSGEMGGERGSERDAELQREGNLGNERNRNEPDSEPNRSR